MDTVGELYGRATLSELFFSQIWFRGRKIFDDSYEFNFANEQFFNILRGIYSQAGQRETFRLDYISRIQSIKNMKSLNSCFITSISLLINNLYTSHWFVLWFREKKIREKLYPSLHYCLLFAIHIYFSDSFVAFSCGLNSMDNNLSDVPRGLNFTNGKFLWYFTQIIFCRKIQNVWNLQNRIHAKINPFNLY